MIAFGSAITSPEAFERLARPGIRLAAEADSRVFAYQAAGSIARSYNLIRREAARLPDLEALVLVHQDAEILDERLCLKVRRALSDSDVGVVGCVGAVGAPGISWWEGAVSGGTAVLRYGQWGGGDMPIVAVGGPDAGGTGEVETLEGIVLVLSPWAVRTLPFDEGLSQLYGHDYDYCASVRAQGRKVVTEDLVVAHHHSLDLVLDHGPWTAAHLRTAEKWDPMRDAGDEAWRRRARRAEGEAALARLLVLSKQMQRDARVADQERTLGELTTSSSWRVTAPLRSMNRLRHGLRGRARQADLDSRAP